MLRERENTIEGVQSNVSNKAMANNNTTECSDNDTHPHTTLGTHHSTISGTHNIKDIPQTEQHLQGPANVSSTLNTDLVVEKTNNLNR